MTSVPSLSSGQQHPVTPWYLGGDGVSTQPCPYGLVNVVPVLEGTSSPRTGKGSAPPFLV